MWSIYQDAPTLPESPRRLRKLLVQKRATLPLPAQRTRMATRGITIGFCACIRAVGINVDHDPPCLVTSRTSIPQYALDLWVHFGHSPKTEMTDVSMPQNLRQKPSCLFFIYTISGSGRKAGKIYEARIGGEAQSAENFHR